MIISLTVFFKFSFLFFWKKKIPRIYFWYFFLPNLLQSPLVYYLRCYKQSQNKAPTSTANIVIKNKQRAYTQAFTGEIGVC